MSEIVAICVRETECSTQIGQRRQQLAILTGLDAALHNTTIQRPVRQLRRHTRRNEVRDRVATSGQPKLYGVDLSRPERQRRLADVRCSVTLAGK